jgi:hypothetical protein
VSLFPHPYCAAGQQSHASQPIKGGFGGRDTTPCGHHAAALLCAKASERKSQASSNLNNVALSARLKCNDPTRSWWELYWRRCDSLFLSPCPCPSTCCEDAGTDQSCHVKPGSFRRFSQQPMKPAAQPPRPGPGRTRFQTQGTFQTERASIFLVQ